MELSQFNTRQKAVLEQFREAVKDCKLPDSHDSYLARWLIARDFDLVKSEKMLRNSLEWRRQNGINTIREDYQAPEVFERYFSAARIGQGKLFNQVFYARYGMMDSVGLLRSGKVKDYITHVTYLFETVMSEKHDKYKRTSETISRAILVLDMDQLSMRHITNKPSMDVIIQLVQIYEANYPETLHRAFIINAPKIFSMAYAVVKPFLHERTRNKINIFSYDQKQWKEAILEEINPEEVPACYGGTLTDPDGNPNCITMVNIGGQVPKSYYINEKPDTANKKLLTISSGHKEILEFHAQNAGDILQWNFHSEDSDIAFAVSRKRGSELIPVIPHGRVDCHLSPEEGVIKCEEPGVYFVEFDNSFSYFRSKKIWYSITVDPPS